MEIAKGVLHIEQFNPLLRIAAFRLLGRACYALEQATEACEAAERAVDEAVNAHYVWLELMGTADLLKWCPMAETESVRLRLRGVAGRCAASSKELAVVLGEGVL